jgi:tetratricopeptide (TPR) repeat protein
MQKPTAPVEQEQIVPSAAEGHYELAKRYYLEARFDQAEVECREALRQDPNHREARRLLYETQVLSGRGQATPLSEQMNREIEHMEVRQKQVQLELDQQFNMGLRYYNAGQYDDAERSFRLVIEYSRWAYPPTVEKDARCRQAQDMLQKTRQAQTQHDMDEARTRSRLIAEENRRLAGEER